MGGAWDGGVVPAQRKDRLWGKRRARVGGSGLSEGSRRPSLGSGPVAPGLSYYSGEWG